MHRSETHPPMRWWTIPNAVSLVRLVVCVPLVIAFLHPGAELVATCCLVAFGATDWIDGALARLLHQQSRVGEILDPVADRVGLLVIGAAATLAGYVPWWCIPVVALSDVVLAVIGLARLHRVREGRVTWLGKVRTAVLMTGLPLHLVSFAPELANESETVRAIAWWMLLVGTVLHVAAAASYARRYLSPSPAVPSRTDGVRRATGPSQNQ